MKLFDLSQPRRLKTITRDPRDKYDAWRLRCRSKGLCTHCGKPSAPFVQCEERREYQRLRKQNGGDLNAAVSLDTINKRGQTLYNYLVDPGLDPLEELMRKEEEEEASRDRKTSNYARRIHARNSGLPIYTTMTIRGSKKG